MASRVGIGAGAGEDDWAPKGELGAESSGRCRGAGVSTWSPPPLSACPMCLCASASACASVIGGGDWEGTVAGACSSGATAASATASTAAGLPTALAVLPELSLRTPLLASLLSFFSSALAFPLPPLPLPVAAAVLEGGERGEDGEEGEGAEEGRGPGDAGEAGACGERACCSFSDAL